MLLFTKLAAPKAPKRRSRAGCSSCKERKKKCDEERPQCARCAERGSACVYEPVRPRQRRKRDSFAFPLTDNSLEGVHHIEDVSDDHVSRRDVFNACDDDLGRRQRLTEAWGHGSWQETMSDPFDDDLIFSPLNDTFDPNVLMSAPLRGTGSIMTILSDHHTSPLNMATQPRILRYEEDDDDDVEEEIDIGGGGAGLIGIKHDRRSSFTSTTTTATNTTGANTIFSTDLTAYSPATVRSPLLEFTCPSFQEFSENPRRRLLVDHFCNVLSHLIVFREETGNPFQQLVLPLMRGGDGSGGGGDDSPVADAVYALAGAHLEHRGVDLDGGEKSLHFHHRAIQGLAGLIRLHNASANRNEVLAAIILLIYYEVLVQRGRSNIVEGHLKGALTVMRSNPEPLDSTGIFLERAFRFYDVIAALSFGTAPLSTAPAAGCLVPFPLSVATATSTLNNVDSLLGMATTLWPIIHRLSGLLPLKTDLAKAREAGHSGKVAVLRTEFDTTVGAVEAALLGWAPNLPAGWALHESDPTKLLEDGTAVAKGETSSGGDSAHLHSIINNALAYRNSALVYLYRTVHSHPRSHPLVQRHAHISLRHCAATVEHQGPMGALLWPLFVAACEAATPDDRATAKAAFAAIDKRQGMTNIERAWDIVQEVWKRAERADDEDLRDQGAWPGIRPVQLSGGCSEEILEAADMWRVVSKEMGVNIVFG